MADYTVKTGGYLTLHVVVTDSKKKKTNVESGYKFVAAVKTNIADDDNNAFVYVDSDNDADRFNITNHEVDVFVLISEETADRTNAPGNYYCGVWMTPAVSNQSEPIVDATVEITNSVPNIK